MNFSLPKRNNPMAMKPRPLESFNPALMSLLLRSLIDPQVIYAEHDRRRPIVYRRDHPLNPHEVARSATTRWHTIVFSSEVAANRFRELIRMSHRLNMLRQSMEHYQHPDAIRALSVRISIDDRKGALALGPADAALDDLLATIEAAKPPQLTADPLATIGDDNHE
jgi:hypothetical protein